MQDGRIHSAGICFAAPAESRSVIVRLKALDDTSTEVTLHHLGWGEGEKWDATYAYFDRAWGNVLANLKKRFETGPVDWTEWMNQLRKFHEQAPAKK